MKQHNFKFPFSGGVAKALVTAAVLLTLLAGSLRVYAQQALPWTEGFESVISSNHLPTGWAASATVGSNLYIYTSAQGVYNMEAHTGSKFAAFYYTAAATYFFTPAFALTAGTNYQYSFWYITDGDGGTTANGEYNFSIKYGTSQTAAAMTNTIGSVLNFNNTTYTQYIVTFTPATSGTYYIGIEAQNSTPRTTANIWCFDDVALSVVANPTLSVTPGSLSFGSVLTNTSSGTQSFNLSGLNLAPAPGNITVAAPAGYMVSLNGTTFSSSINVPNASATLASTPVYVQFDPTANGTVTGNITISGGGVTAPATVAVSGNGAPACTVPVDQPSAVVFNTAATVMGSVTPGVQAILTDAAPPTGYIAVASTAALTGAPVNSTTYTVGQAIGNGTVVGISTTDTVSLALTSNTPYIITIFPYSSSACAGIIYNTLSPISAGLTTPVSYCVPQITTTPDACASIYAMDVHTTGGAANVAYTGTTPCSMLNPTQQIGYRDFTATQGVAASAGQNITLTIGNKSYVNYYGVYVDWNQNGTFEAGEQVVGATSIAANASSPFTITIPANAAIGATRLRIVENGYNSLPVCGNSSFLGDVADFGFTVLPSGTVAITNTGSNSFCVTGSTTFNLTGLAGINVNSGIVTQWQSSTNGVTWANAGPDTPSVTYATGTLTATTYFRNIITYVSANINDTTNIDTVTINAAINPALVIGSSSGSTICAGNNVTFIAAPTNGGTAPTYQWVKNGASLPGATTNTYSDNSLADGDKIYCTLTTNAACAAINTVNSDTVTMSVTTNFAPSVSITPVSAICAGSSVTLTAQPNGGGNAPIYQWKVNGTTVNGVTGNTYTTTSLNDNDQVTVTMTGNSTCATTNTATSTPVTITVNPVVAPSVSVDASATTVCQGTSISFTITSGNGGTTPTYQWTKNGASIPGATNAAYTTSSLNNGDLVGITLTSNATCVSPAIVSSVDIPVTVNPILVPTVSVNANNTTICAGASATFTTTTNNAGTAPTYQWTNDGTAIPGATTNSYTSSTLNNNDQIALTLTSNATCATPATVTSTAVIMIVNPLLLPTASISASNTTICAGTAVTFTAATTNAGTIPTYQWTDNGAAIAGATAASYISDTLNNNDHLSLTLTSNAACATPATLNTDTVTMIVNPLDTLAVSLMSSPGDTLCANVPVTVIATVTGAGNTPVYQWALNGVVAGADSTYTDSTPTNNDVIAFTTIGSASCTIHDTVTNTVAITVHPLPVPVITQAPSNLLSTGNFSTYQWYLNDTLITGATNSFYIPTQNGSYTVSVTDVNGCTAISAADTVTTLGIPTVAAGSSKMQLYPNPNAGTFTLEGTITGSKEAQIEVLNVVGQVVYSTTLTPQNGNLKQQIVLPGENANGIYLLHIQTDNGSNVIRFVMER